MPSRPTLDLSSRVFQQATSPHSLGRKTIETPRPRHIRFPSPSDPPAQSSRTGPTVYDTQLPPLLDENTPPAYTSADGTYRERKRSHEYDGDAAHLDPHQSRLRSDRRSGRDQEFRLRAGEQQLGIEAVAKGVRRQQQLDGTQAPRTRVAAPAPPSTPPEGLIEPGKVFYEGRPASPETIASLRTDGDLANRLGPQPQFSSGFRVPIARPVGTSQRRNSVRVDVSSSEDGDEVQIVDVPHSATGSGSRQSIATRASDARNGQSLPLIPHNTDMPGDPAPRAAAIPIRKPEPHDQRSRYFPNTANGVGTTAHGRVIDGLQPKPGSQADVAYNAAMARQAQSGSSTASPFQHGQRGAPQRQNAHHGNRSAGPSSNTRRLGSTKYTQSGMGTSEYQAGHANESQAPPSDWAPQGGGGGGGGLQLGHARDGPNQRMPNNRNASSGGGQTSFAARAQAARKNQGQGQGEPAQGSVRGSYARMAPQAQLKLHEDTGRNGARPSAPGPGLAERMRPRNGAEKFQIGIPVSDKRSSKQPTGPAPQQQSAAKRASGQTIEISDDELGSAAPSKEQTLPPKARGRPPADDDDDSDLSDAPEISQEDPGGSTLKRTIRYDSAEEGSSPIKRKKTAPSSSTTRSSRRIADNAADDTVIDVEDESDDGKDQVSRDHQLAMRLAQEDNSARRTTRASSGAKKTFNLTGDDDDDGDVVLASREDGRLQAKDKRKAALATRAGQQVSHQPSLLDSLSRSKSRAFSGSTSVRSSAGNSAYAFVLADLMINEHVIEGTRGNRLKLTSFDDHFYISCGSEVSEGYKLPLRQIVGADVVPAKAELKSMLLKVESKGDALKIYNHVKDLPRSEPREPILFLLRFADSSESNAYEELLSRLNAKSQCKARKEPDLAETAEATFASAEAEGTLKLSFRQSGDSKDTPNKGNRIAAFYGDVGSGSSSKARQVSASKQPTLPFGKRKVQEPRQNALRDTDTSSDDEASRAPQKRPRPTRGRASKSLANQRMSRGGTDLWDDDDISSAYNQANGTRVARLKPEDDTQILRFPAEGPGSVSLFKSDALKLADGEFLNDTIIEFALKYIHKTLEQAEDPAKRSAAEDILVFSSFFYKRLTSVKNDPDACYERVRKWTKGDVAFRKKYIVVPINEALHWYLAIIVNPERMLDAKYESGSDADDDAIAIAEPSKTSPKAAPSKDEVRVSPAARRALASANEEIVAESPEPEEADESQPALQPGDSTEMQNIPVPEAAGLANPMAVPETAASTPRHAALQLLPGADVESPAGPSQSANEPTVPPALNGAMETPDAAATLPLAEALAAINMDGDSQMADASLMLKGPAQSTASTSVEAQAATAAILASAPGSALRRSSQLNTGEERAEAPAVNPDEEEDELESDKEDAATDERAVRATIAGSKPASVGPDENEEEEVERSMAPVGALAQGASSSTSNAKAIVTTVISPVIANGTPNAQASRSVVAPAVTDGGASERPGESPSERGASGIHLPSLSQDDKEDNAPVDVDHASMPNGNAGKGKLVGGGGIEPGAALRSHRAEAEKAEKARATRSASGSVTLKGSLSAYKPQGDREAKKSPTPPPQPKTKKQQRIVASLEQKSLPVVITFDSLKSGSHLRVARDLSFWLRREAKVKKEVEVDERIVCEHVEAQIPQQSNWYDCGIYVVHFFERFASDPEAAIAELKTCNKDAVFWEGNEVLTKRTYWKSVIHKLSEPWLKAKEEEEKKELDRRREAANAKRQAQIDEKAEGSGAQDKEDSPSTGKDKEAGDKDGASERPLPELQLPDAGEESDGFEMITQPDGSQVRSPRKNSKGKEPEKADDADAKGKGKGKGKQRA